MSVVSKAAACVAFAAVALFLPVALQVAAPAPAGAAIVPPQNPGANISPAPGYSGPCGSLAAPNPYCPSGLTLLYGDRQVEGLSPMSLPSNYPSLTPPEQLFVLTDLERIDRGLPPSRGSPPTSTPTPRPAPTPTPTRPSRPTGASGPPPTPPRRRWGTPWPCGCTTTGRAAPTWTARRRAGAGAGPTGTSSSAPTPLPPSWGWATAPRRPSSSWGVTPWTPRTSPGPRRPRCCPWASSPTA